MLTPPMPSNSSSTSLLSRQSPILAMYVRWVSYCLYPRIRLSATARLVEARRPRLTLSENDVLGQPLGQLTALIRLDPGVVINCGLSAVHVPCYDPVRFSYIVPRYQHHFRSDETKHLERISILLALYSTANLLGTRISLSCHMKSSMISFGLSTMSTSRQ